MEVVSQGVHFHQRAVGNLTDTQEVNGLVKDSYIPAKSKKLAVFLEVDEGIKQKAADGQAKC